jgi:FixJ family two-component response regulator
MYVDAFDETCFGPKGFVIPPPARPLPAHADSSIRFIGNDGNLLHMLRTDMPPLGFGVNAYATGANLLAEASADSVGCVVLDVRLPGISGIELLAKMEAHDTCMPFIFVTAHGDIALAVRAMKQGAFDFLEKPCRSQDLVDSITKAMTQSQLRYQNMLIVRILRSRFERLTITEKKIMEMVVEGQLNKQIASRLCRSEMTIKVHRRRVMEKMEAGSLAELVRIARKLQDTKGRRLF